MGPTYPPKIQCFIFNWMSVFYLATTITSMIFLPVCLTFLNVFFFF